MQLKEIFQDTECAKPPKILEVVSNLEWSTTILQGKEKILYHVISGEEANTVQSTLDNFL